MTKCDDCKHCVTIKESGVAEHKECACAYSSWLGSWIQGCDACKSFAEREEEKYYYLVAYNVCDGGGTIIGQGTTRATQSYKIRTFADLDKLEQYIAIDIAQERVSITSWIELEGDGRDENTGD